MMIPTQSSQLHDLSSDSKMNKQNSHDPWYKEGLRFECTGCGGCCTGSPGYVWVNENEIAEMASFLSITVQEFGKRYLRQVGGRFALIEKKKTYDCVFLKDKKCLLYAVRPTQCRTFPWWPENISSQDAWEQAAKQCEGIRDQAPLVPCETIEEQLLIQIRRK